MPAGLIKSLAEQYGCTVERVESAWADCKAGVNPGQGGKGYGLVVDCVKAKLGKRAKAKATRAVRKARK